MRVVVRVNAGLAGIAVTLVVAGCSVAGSGSRTPPPRRPRPSTIVQRPAALPPALTITAQPSANRTGAWLAPGTVVRPAGSDAGVFADARHGFTLASIDYVTYPLATVDGGRTWRIAGPALPLVASAGTVAGSQPGVAGPQTYFASEGLGMTTVVEVTTDAGKHWWQAFLPGGAVFVGAFGGELTAIVAAPSNGTSDAPVAMWAYHSRSGRRWSYDGTLNSLS